MTTSPWLFQAKKEELHIGLGIPKAAAIEIHNWAEEQDWPDGTELEPIDEYHITMLFAPERGKLDQDGWKHESHAVSITGITSFPSKENGPDHDAIVLTIDSETIHDHHKELVKRTEKAGLEISAFSGDDFKPHLTIAYGKLPKSLKPPLLTFETEPSEVSPPREHDLTKLLQGSWEGYGCGQIWINEKKKRILINVGDGEGDKVHRIRQLAKQKWPEYDVETDAEIGFPGDGWELSSDSAAKPTKEEEKKSAWNIVKARPPYEAALVRFSDSWTPKDQWPNALRERNGEPADVDCTCKDGHKLDCPVHGMHPTLPTYDDTLEFPDPSSPVGYDYHTEAPRTWMRAETSKKAKHDKLWVDDTRRPPSDDWDWARNVAEAIELTKGPPGEPKAGYKHMSLDHDLGIVQYEGKVVVNPDALDGGDFVLWLHEHGDKKHMPKSVNIHSHNEDAIELMVKALEPHTKVTTKRAPDHLEEEWAREFKVHEPSAIEEETIDLPERSYHTSSHQLAWLPGSNLKGKGLVTPSGDVHTWPVDTEGMPHHAEYVDRRQPYQLHEGTAYFFQIRPRGGLDTQGYDIPPNIISHVLRTVPSLRAGESTDWHFATSSGLQSVLNNYEALRPRGGWNCDSGAAVLSHMLGRAGIPAYLRCGQYLYPTSADRERVLGEPGDWLDEHHHWVEVGGLDEPTHLIDPNGELRGEPRIQPYTPEVAARYVTRDDPNSRGDREFMSWSPLWDYETEGLHSADDSEMKGDSQIRRYLKSTRQAADQWDTREYPDTRMMPPTTMQEPVQNNPHPEKQGCTCEEGDKLNCPVHGMNPTEHRYDHSWSIPQGHPVGYPQDQPRNYMKAEGKYWNFQDDPEPVHIHELSPEDGEESWTGLPRAEGAVEDEDEHQENLEGENVAIPTPPPKLRKKRKEREDLELAQESNLLHSAA